LTPIGPQPDSRAAEESQELTTTSPSQSKWIPTQQSFEKLLAVFDSNRDEAGKHYEKIRVKLLRYFERREITDADRYVDETLDRVMRRLDEGEVIANVMAYVYTVASFVRLEAWKQQEQMRKAESEMQRTVVVTHQQERDESPRQLCFDRCLGKLPIETRILIREYYSEEGSVKIQLRKQIAQRLGIRLNALRIRAHKIRVSLETCVKDCVARFT
jgi:DNA-directed RNA polymerase specialized sigma24 family protein